MRPLDEKITFELRDGIEHIHGHRAGRAGEIDAAKRARIDGPANPFVREGELQALTQNMEADFTVQLAKQTKQGSPK